MFVILSIVKIFYTFLFFFSFLLFSSLYLALNVEMGRSFFLFFFLLTVQRKDFHVFPFFFFMYIYIYIVQITAYRYVIVFKKYINNYHTHTYDTFRVSQNN